MLFKQFPCRTNRTKFFAKNFSKNSDLNDFGISLPVFPSRTNLKLHIISLTTMMFKKVTTNLDSLKASGPDFIPVAVLKNCEPELLFILVEIFNVSERILFSRLLEGRIGGLCI